MFSKYLLHGFRRECAYCFHSIYEKEGLMLCECGVSVCRPHSSKHESIKDHEKRVTVFAKGDPADVSVHGEEVSEEECKDIREEIMNWLLRPESVMEDGQGRKKCAHMQSLYSRLTEDGAPGKKQGTDSPADLEAKCTECEIDSNTWMCLCCGEVFCGRKQYGIEGNGHARLHFEKKNPDEQPPSAANAAHCLFSKVQSISPRGRNETYCYKCDDLVENTHLAEIAKRHGKSIAKCAGGGGTAEIEYRLNKDPSQAAAEMEEKEEEKKSLRYRILQENTSMGITNLGNTCYISSVLQMVAYGLRELDHIEGFCPTNEPVECFGCQFIKVIEHLRTGWHQQEVVGSFPNGGRPISIGDFRRIIEMYSPSFQLGVQQDATEFLYLLMSLIGEAEAMGHLFGVAKTFRFELEATTFCGLCDRRHSETTSEFILPIGTEEHGVDGFFKREKVDVKCTCGESFKYKENKITVAPSTLLVSVQRMSYGTEGTKNPLAKGAVKRKIEIGKYLKKGAGRHEGEKPDMASESREMLFSMGFSENECSDALRKCGYDVSKAIEMLVSSPQQGGAEHPRTEYSLCGAVIHMGSANAGHYIAQFSGSAGNLEGAEDLWIAADDEKIGEGPLIEEDVYVMSYEVFNPK